MQLEGSDGNIYRIVKHLGSGKSSDVYLAKCDTGDVEDEWYVVKILKDVSDDKEFMKEM